MNVIEWCESQIGHKNSSVTWRVVKNVFFNERIITNTTLIFSNSLKLYFKMLFHEM